MSKENIMEQVRRFIRTYPPLSNDKINVDFLPADARSYAIEAVPAQETVRSYVDGSSVRQFLFVLASREYYGEKIRQQLDNLGFYEDFFRWMQAQTRVGNLPALGEGRKAMAMEATTLGYAFHVNEDKARYQIQCRLEYFQKAEKTF